MKKLKKSSELEIIKNKILWLLHGWKYNFIDEYDVHELAEKWFEDIDQSYLNLKDEEKIPSIEVLSHLEIMNHQLIIPDDIPIMIEYIQKDCQNSAWKIWKEYWDNVDFKLRKK